MLPKDNLFYGLRPRMTEEQSYFVNCILDNTVTFCNSISGSGKTTMATASLKYLYQRDLINKAYYIFSPVEENTLGHRPGYTKEKEEDYTHPLKDALAKIGDQPDKALDEKIGWIEAKSHTFIRGRNKERVGIILDEAQNYTRLQLKKTISRVHDDCHLVVIGHHGQIDLDNSDLSGFQGCIDHFSKDERVKVCKLTYNFRGWVSRLADTL